MSHAITDSAATKPYKYAIEFTSVLSTLRTLLANKLSGMAILINLEAGSSYYWRWFKNYHS